MAIRALLFDLDGTLVDSLADIADATNFALGELGFPGHSLERYRAFVGDGMSMLARRSLPDGHRDDATVAACVERMKRRYAANSRNETRPYEGIPELLDGIVARGLFLSVLSNKPHDLTVKLVGELLARWPFEPVYGERPGVPRKPDPGAALEIAQRLGLAPEQVLYVGDTPTDLATARAAGMPSVAAGWGFRSASELRAAGATQVAAHPLELLGQL